MLNEKKYVSLSVCKSNVKKEGVYYARVRKNGKIKKEDLIKKAQEKAPYFDAHTLEVAFEVLGEAALEYVEEGFDVDLFGLGTVGLKAKGSLKVSEPLMKNIDGAFNERDEKAGKIETTESDTIEGNYEIDLTSIAKKDVEFSLQFSPSRQVKKHIKNYVKPARIMTKMQKPKIESVEKVCSSGEEGSPSVIKIKGDDLKLVGEGMELYIKTGNKIIQVPKEAVLQNEPKTLMILVNVPLKAGKKYSLGISTQYAKMGNRQTSVIRRCVKEFSLARMGDSRVKKAG